MRETPDHRRDLHADGAGGAAAGGAIAVELSPLMTLLAGHLLPDGETVLMVLKPSPLLVVLSSLKTLAFAAIVAIAGVVFDSRLPGAPTVYGNVALLIASTRLMVATVLWMGRYYVLTDMRVMELAGVFGVRVVECPLRKVARVRLLRTLRDRICLLGTVEIIPQEEEHPICLWQTVARPREVRERVQRAVARAKQGGRGTL